MTECMHGLQLNTIMVVVQLAHIILYLMITKSIIIDVIN